MRLLEKKYRDAISEDPMGLSYKLKRSEKFALAVSCALIGLIGWLTLSPAPQGDLSLSDKAYHVLAFASVTFPVAFVQRWSKIWIVLIAIGYGAAIELVQPFFGRGQELGDALANSVGAVLGTIVGDVIARWHVWLLRKNV